MEGPLGAAGDGPVMPTYRIIFDHVRRFAKFEIRITAPTRDAAQRAGERFLVQHLRRTAGDPADWSYAETVEETR